MKLNTHAFPYPVLTHDEGAGADYCDSAFQCPLIFSLVDGEEEKLKIEYRFDLANEEIDELIADGSASFALEIKCGDTVTRKIKFLEREGVLELDVADFYGKVEFTPMVTMRRSHDGFTSPDLNEEFSNATFNLSMGDVLAVDDTHTQFIEFDNHSFNSLVKVDTDETLPPFQYKIDFSPHYILSLIHI